MGAILMASCGRKIDDEIVPGTLIETDSSYKGGEFAELFRQIPSNSQISNRQGVGKLDAYWAYTIVRDGSYWSLTLGSSVTSYTKNIYITKGANTLTRVSIFWLMKREPVLSNNQMIYVPQTGLNWNLYIEDPNGNEIYASTTEHNNYEIVQFVPPVSGTYTITIERSGASNYPLSYVGLAVW